MSKITPEELSELQAFVTADSEGALTMSPKLTQVWLCTLVSAKKPKGGKVQ